VDEHAPPQALLGSFEPIMRAGLRRLLAEDGVDVVGEEHSPEPLVAQAGRLQPDVVLLVLNDEGARELGRRVQRAAPRATVILWTRDESVMEVFDPAGEGVRRVAVNATGGLPGALASSYHRQRVGS
jgi:DNA-binding NarL/FixJ family response regulator